ncbi:hypothetical protein RHGRI_031532 [Rhododendron griersonianum]|uniref:ATP-dependent DNA helicase n=1 Tax=Rhododendron griersonianum TaxID=479676 RepID=A0AAV6I8Z1_9ERIC|nr:hypothetical protein RHGRI_031532 [Rhododendron griersonianum]
MGVHLDLVFAKRLNGIYTFRAQGPIYHFIDGLYPSGQMPSYLQLYFYDTEKEAELRRGDKDKLQPEIISGLIRLLEGNPYSQFFRGLTHLPNIEECQIVLKADPKVADYTALPPTVPQVAAIWLENEEAPELQERDIIVHKHDGHSQTISNYFGCYDPLQYPLLFPLGEPGWHQGIRKIKRKVPQVRQENAKKANMVSAREFYAYRLQIRKNTNAILLESARLLQQFTVDMHVKIETSRLDYFRNRQEEIRADLYQGIVDSIAHGESDPSKIGKRIVLPGTFIGGPRDMRKQYLNAMTLVERYGKPDLFLTMTCNPSWQEIKDEMKPHEEAQNRPDLVSRVFRSKLEHLQKEILLYKNFPEHFVWTASSRTWTERKQQEVIGRIVTANPTEGERYYLRLLLTHIPAPISYAHLRTANGITFNSYREAAISHGLLQDDNTNEKCMEEACLYRMPLSLRQLFCTIFVYCAPFNPLELFYKFEDDMTEDYISIQKFTRDGARQVLLQTLNAELESMGKNLHDFQLSHLLTSDSTTRVIPKEVQDEMNLSISEDDLRSPALLNAEQAIAYDEILDAVLNRKAKSFFIDGPGAILIIWDEASMAKKETIEALDWLLRDLTENDILFGGKVVVLGGDFRQVLPVIPKGTKIDCMNASLVRSYIWQSLIKFKLKENMRAKTDPAFSRYILQVGNGLEEENEVGEIKLPSSLILEPNTQVPPLEQLIQFVFPSFDLHRLDPLSLTNSAILMPKNQAVDEINEVMIGKFPGKEHTYLSFDETSDPTQQGLYIDFLNSVQMAPNIIALKDITLTSKNFTVQAMVVEKNIPRMSSSGTSLYQRIMLQDKEDQFSEYEAHGMANLPGSFPVVIGLRLKTSKYYGCTLATRNSSSFIFDAVLPKATTLQSWAITNTAKLRELAVIEPEYLLIPKGPENPEDDTIKSANLPISVDKVLQTVRFKTTTLNSNIEHER